MNRFSVVLMMSLFVFAGTGLFTEKTSSVHGALVGRITAGALSSHTNRVMAAAKKNRAALNRRMLSAVMGNDLAGVKRLIGQGADVNARTGIMEEWKPLNNLSGYAHRDLTPYDLAVELGHNDIAEFLKSRGGISDK